MNYDFYSFNPGDFEQLVQALFINLLGNQSIVFGMGADGGRELTYRGKASFGSPLEYHDGLWLLQAKFRSRDVHDHDQYDWVKRNFISEMRKFESGNYPVPDQYIFVTNAVLTPGFQKGGRDKIESLITHYNKLIPRIYVVSYDELCALLLNNADVRQAFEHLLLPGDKFAVILDLLKQQGMHRQIVLAEQEIREFPTRHSYIIPLPPNPILTIDFGTSYSLCGVMTTREDVALVPTPGGGTMLPSVVSFLKNGCYMVGNNLLRHVNNSEVVSVAHIKRYLATDRKFKVFDRFYNAKELATLVIKSLKTNAEEFFGHSFTNVIVAKPANYNLRQTRALSDAFENAGFKVDRILDEGTAAAYLFPLVEAKTSKMTQGKKFLVMDLGGGTFDLSFQDFEDGVLETKAVLGDNALGGIDYDHAVLELARSKINAKYGHIRNVNFITYIPEAERIKKELSIAEVSTFMISDHDNGDGNLKDLTVTITRDEFRDCTSALNSKIMRCMGDIVGMGNRSISYSRSRGQLDAIMLTGQGAKIFTVKEVIQMLFPDVPLIEDYMENAVCMGNSYQAGVIQGIIKNSLLLSVQNTGLAIKVKNISKGHNSQKSNVFDMAPVPELNTMFGTLLNANDSIPTRQTFDLYVQILNADQTNFIVPVFEVTGQGSKFDEISAIVMPVVYGGNHLQLVLEIAANYAITINVTNRVNGYTKNFPLG